MRSPEGSLGPASPDSGQLQRLQSWGEALRRGLAACFASLPFKNKAGGKAEPLGLGGGLARILGGSLRAGCGEPFCLSPGVFWRFGQSRAAPQGGLRNPRPTDRTQEPTKLTSAPAFWWQFPREQMLEQHKNKGFKKLFPHHHHPPGLTSTSRMTR